jgi:hypothetical protein
VRPFVLALVMMIVNGGTSLANDNLSSMNSADTVDISNPVDLRDGRLSVSENNLSLVELMQLVGAEANFNVVAYGDLEGKTGSWSFSDLALIEAVRKLLRDTSTIIIYRPGNDSDVEPEISTVYLLGSNSAKVDPIRITTIETGLDNQLRLDQAQVDDVQNRLADIDRSEGLTDEITLGNLAFALRHDPDPEVRIRAVSALDGIGSKAAVTALEGGLGDLDASVRKKVTLAFGKINDERIPLWLGQILMGDPSAEVRLVAVQSIAQKEGDIARIFLEAATGDSSSMVSEAALQLTR